MFNNIEYYKSLVSENISQCEEFKKEQNNLYLYVLIISSIVQILSFNFSFFMPKNKSIRIQYYTGIVTCILGRKIHNEKTKKRKSEWDSKINEGITIAQNNKTGG